MNKFKFIKDKNKFIWQNNSIKIQFSKPNIQAYPEFDTLDDDKKIMYYYYNVKILKKVATYKNIDEDKPIYKWKTLTEINTYDFPCIQQLKDIINYQINNNPTKNGQKIRYLDGDIKYKETLSTEGFACDDFYEISKYSDDKGLENHYSIYFGCTLDIQSSMDNEGIRINYIDEEEIKELLKCVNDFISFSINLYNKTITTYNKLHTKNKEIISGKIYEYTIEKNKINKNKIENIFVINDFGNFTCVKKKNKKYETIEYEKMSIQKINKSSITLNNNIEIPINELLNIYDDIPKEKLNYNIDDITQDFIDILDDKEKEIFKKEKLENLIQKYKMPLINRTWMCRPEHKFDIDYDSGDSIDTINPIIKEVIINIKNNI